MPRIFKGSESTLRLLIHTCNQEGKISDLKIALYTNDPSVAIEFTDRYTIDGNIVSLTVPNYAFGTMEDGVINYVAQGMIDDDTFLTERQSNYFLKTPANYTPTPMPEEVVLGELTTMIVENGVFEYTPSDVDAWKKATIEVNVPSEGGSCNLGEGEILLDTTMAGTYELYASDDGYDGWSKFYVTLENDGAIKIHKAEDLVNTFNNGEQIDFGAYYYVGGKITEIQEINTQNGNATYVLDNGLKVYRGDWIDGNPFGEDQIKVGGYIVVYGIIQDYNGELQLKAHSQVIAYQECEGGEIVSCNIQEYKWVRPSMADRAENGDIYIYPDEGYDAVGYIDFDPSGIYDEAYNEGKIAGKAEGGDLTIGTGDIFLSVNERGQRFEILPSEFEYDAFDKFIVELENFDLGGDTNIYDALSVNQLLMDGVISYGNRYIFKGQITEIQRIRPEYGDARYTLDGSLNVYNGQTMGYDIQVGDNVIVIGTLSEYNGAPQFNAGSEIKAWWREGSGSGDCNIQPQKKVDLNSSWEVFYPDEGYDGIYEVVVQADAKVEEWREEGKNDVRNKLQSIEITENGRYSAEDTIYVESLKYNGGYHTDTISTYDINRIEVTFKADTSGSINGQGQPFILGGSLFGVEEGDGTNNAAARAIQYAYGRIVGYWEGKWTDAEGAMDGEWLTIILDENGMTVKYPTYESYMEYTHDNGHTNNGADIFPFIIGGLGGRAVDESGNYTANLIEDTQFRGLIKEVKINTNSMGEITYIPKDLGYGVWDRVVENTGEHLSALEPTEGEITMNGEWERKYGEGWKEINVNIPSYTEGIEKIKSYNQIAFEIKKTAGTLEVNDYSIDKNDFIVMNSDTTAYVWSYRTISEGVTHINQNAFSDYAIISSLKTTTITTLGERAFLNCGNLKEVEFSMAIGRLGAEAFDGCFSLNKIVCKAEGAVILGTDVFRGLPENGTLYLKEGVDETPWLEKLPSGWTVERI